MTGQPSRLSAALADRYRLERELGQGGMATVYQAEDVRHRRRVAVKVLRSELTAALGPERFLREIETTANLRHRSTGTSSRRTFCWRAATRWRRCPLWAPDSRRVFFRNADHLVAVELRTAPALAVVRRTTSAGFWASGTTAASTYDDVYYDLSPDGRTFVVVTPVRTDARVLVAFNWAEELRREWAGGRK